MEFCARRRLVIIGLATAAALIGLRSLQRLPLDALPDVGDKQVIVCTRNGIAARISSTAR